MKSYTKLRFISLKIPTLPSPVLAVTLYKVYVFENQLTNVHCVIHFISCKDNFRTPASYETSFSLGSFIIGVAITFLSYSKKLDTKKKFNCSHV